MAQYIKKPIMIEAIQWTGTNVQDIQKLNRGVVIRRQIDDSGYYLAIPTLEGVMIARKGDWIIRGVQDELYPCKPDIFKASYYVAVADGEGRALADD